MFACLRKKYSYSTCFGMVGRLQDKIPKRSIKPSSSVAPTAFHVVWALPHSDVWPHAVLAAVLGAGAVAVPGARLVRVKAAGGAAGVVRGPLAVTAVDG